MAETKKTSIQKKLLEFQKLGISVKKSKTNPHFKNKFADINEILDKIKEPLNKLGIVLIQLPTEEGLKTILHDTDSGTEVEGYLEFCQKSDPQKLGSNITYYRRYSLLAMLGLEDDDDDGNSAAKAPAKAEMTVVKALKLIKETTSVKDLTATFKTFPVEIRKNEAVIEKCKEVKEDIESIN